MYDISVKMKHKQETDQLVMNHEQQVSVMLNLTIRIYFLILLLNTLILTLCIHSEFIY